MPHPHISSWYEEWLDGCRLNVVRRHRRHGSFYEIEGRDRVDAEAMKTVALRPQSSQ